MRYLGLLTASNVGIIVFIKKDFFLSQSVIYTMSISALKYKLPTTSARLTSALRRVDSGAHTRTVQVELRITIINAIHERLG